MKMTDKETDYQDDPQEGCQQDPSLLQPESPESYAERLYPVDEQLRLTREVLLTEGLPDISVAPAYGRLLTLLVKMKGARRILEIGALGGYSGICLARGLGPDGDLISLEIKEEFARVARANLAAAGLAARAEVRVGNARASLVRLVEEGQRFDFFFIDADKENYLEYLDRALELSNPGAVIVADNTFMTGKALDPSRTGPGVRGIRRFNELVAVHPRLESTMLPAYDGLTIARVRE
ncbi:O-methyltransferase [Gorillibacterium massiliense]|uniref:O-methyltransferase n=1 Tax=Gorillibacterium massiliense TaxID=1280390 RepID=UPI0004BCF165|nr:O-methyltransferase [Gorillibacterium massiliense]